MRVKILVTLGPSISDYNVIRKLIEEGVSGFRINYIHGSPNEWDEWIKMVREASEELDKVVSIIGDIPGPQIRIGDFTAFEVKARDKIILFYGGKSEERKIPIPHKKLFEVLEIGDTILLDDGKVILKTIEVGEDYAETIALNSAIIYPRKKIVISGKEIDLPLFSDRDIELIKFSVSRNINYLAFSFIRSASDLSVIRDILSRLGGEQGVIAKIETRSSVYDFDNIVEKADAILIARGDLGLHLDLEKLPIIQRSITRKTVSRGKPCIVATQLLESMVNYPRPTRSEVVDVMNAVYDMVDALLLTNETAIGKYPIESVKWLKKIIEVAESSLEKRVIDEFRDSLEYNSLRDKHAIGLTLLGEKVNAKILIYTKTGTLPPYISRVRPQIAVYVGAGNKKIAERFTIYYGLNPYYIKPPTDKPLDYDEGVKLLFTKLRESGELRYGEVVVEAYGRKELGIHEIKIRQVI